MMVLIDRQAGICGICRDPLTSTEIDISELHIDHILAISMDGTNDLGNLQVTHSYCNESKGNQIAYRNGRYGQRYGR